MFEKRRERASCVVGSITRLATRASWRHEGRPTRRDRHPRVHRHRGFDEAAARARRSRRTRSALAEHRRLLREAFARHGGVEVDTQGDAFFYAFADAREAIAAAEEGREALRPGRIHVRVGIHTGSPHLGPEGYVGEDVHLGARIGAAGHGGQVLLSDATRRSAGSRRDASSTSASTA